MNGNVLCAEKVKVLKNPATLLVCVSQIYYHPSQNSKRQILFRYYHQSDFNQLNSH